jgi:hypothetical protein
MYPANSPSTIDDNSNLLLACISAQDESFVRPLREYLEANGCRVILTTSAPVGVAYHIVAGDLAFVKQIIPHALQSHTKTLGIVMGADPSDAKSLIDQNCKIVVVDPSLLSQTDVIEIFSFFFAGEQEVLDKRRNRHVLSEAPQEGLVQPVAIVSEVPQVAVSKEESYQVLSDQDEHRIGSIISDVFKDDHSSEESKKRGPYKKHKKLYQKIWGGIFLVCAILFIPVFWYGGSVSATGVSFGMAAKNLETGNTVSAQQWERIGGYWLSQSKVSLGIIKTPLQLLGFIDAVRGQERLVSFLSDTKSAFSQTHEVVQMGKEVSTLILSTTIKEAKQSPAATLDKLRISVSSLNGSLGLAQAQLSTLIADKTFPFSVGPFGRVGQKASTSLISIRRMLSYVDQLLLLYPRLAGFTEPKTYLVLLQNSSELRPTGGFIGSIGKLTFDGGVMSDFTIQDVYVVDGQLKGHVDPPLPIRELMSQEHWYLRDSNWDPDFEESGGRAAWFYEKETGETVDGVIAVSLPVVVDILKATGPIVLSDYNDQITAENFLGKSIYYTKNDFFPGSTAKSDFLGTLARTLLLKLTSETTINPMQIFAAMVSGIERRDIQFMFVNSQLQDLVEHFGWAGKVHDHAGCGGVEVGRCVYDPIHINEANISVSKVNAFVSRDTHREVNISPIGEVTQTVTTTITNAAADNEPGVGGTYKTYVRFFLPSDASVSDITLDGVPIPSRDPKAREVPQLPYIERVDAPTNLLALGAAIEVAPGTNRRLRISYARAGRVPTEGKPSYLELGYIKQSGVGEATLRTTIHYPLAWSAQDQSAGEPSLVAKDGQFEYNTSLLQDQFLRVEFTP